MSRSNILIMLFFLFLIKNLESFNRSLFYRVSNFWDEPRFERFALTSLNIDLLGGSTCKSKDFNSCTKPLFGLFGFDEINSKKFNFFAKFSMFEADLNVYQNFSRGFFWHVHIPIIWTKIRALNFKCNPILVNKDCKKIKKPKTIDNVEKTLRKNDISLTNIKDNGLSDSTLFGGWTINYEDTTYLDFIDFTAKLGILFPTGKLKDQDVLFDIPYGYNGHWGLPWSFDLSFGLFEWLTIGLHNDGVKLFDNSQCLRYDNKKCATGIIRKNLINACVDPGLIWRSGAYLKADHIAWGFSIFLAFSFEEQKRSSAKLKNKVIQKFIDSDNIFGEWNRSIFNIAFEYDFAKQDFKYNPRIALYYNHQINGKRVFNTNTQGSNLGLDFELCY